MINKILIYFNVFVIIASSCNADVKLIQATIRHAARNPAGSTFSYFYYPNDPYKDHDWSPEKPLGLTKTGKRNAYDFGIFLRNKYQILINSGLNETHAYFHAINMSRTIDTARLMATGFFSTSKQSWDANSPLIDVPIDIEPIIQDFLNYAVLFCENYNIDQNQAYARINRLFRALSDIQDFYSYLSHYTGVQHTHSRQGWLLFHQLTSESNVGLTLEPWTNTIFPNGRLLDISAVEYILQTYTARMKRLTGGMWIKTFLNLVDELVINKTSQIEGHFHVCTEMQVAAILNTLGVYKPHVPGYLSTILFELHEINEDYYVKVIYKNADTIEDLIIPGCEKSMCLLSTFRNALSNVTMKNFDEDCGKRGYFPIISSVLH